MIKIDAAVVGIPQLQQKLAKLEDALTLVKILDEAEAIVLNRIRARFLNEVDTDGDPWPESEAAKKRRASGRGGGTLFDTGTLFHSIQAFASGPDWREIGTDVHYGKYHQYGTEHLPVREFLGVSAEDALIVERSILRRVEEALK